jgi:two-component system copper resistance phosphate regulon response regulator CusR
MNILLVEDELKIAAFVCKGLEEHGYKLKSAKDGATAKELLRASVFDLLILDIMLPDIDGIGNGSGTAQSIGIKSRGR